jgi:hypothetical protein
MLENVTKSLKDEQIFLTPASLFFHLSRSYSVQMVVVVVTCENESEILRNLEVLIFDELNE